MLLTLIYTYIDLESMQFLTVDGLQVDKSLEALSEETLE